MDLQKIVIKFFASDPNAVPLPEFIPVLNDWIRNAAVPGLLVDVADYCHVPEGPGVVLIGHDVDYCLDSAEGPLGLMCTQKGKLEGSNSERILEVARRALAACRTLEQEPSLGGRLTFRFDEALLIVNDRLLAPNTDETFQAVEPDVRSALSVLYNGADAALERDTSDPRGRFTVRIRVQGAQPAL